MTRTRRRRSWRRRRTSSGRRKAGRDPRGSRPHGAKSADDLKACTDSARTVQNQAIDVLNQKQAGTDVNSQIDGLNTAIDQNTSLCNTSQQSYQAFVDALSKLQNK